MLDNDGMIDVNRLKHITAEAIERGKKKLQEEDLKKRKAAYHKSQLDLAKARDIVLKIPALAERAAESGKSEVEIMEVKEYTDPCGWARSGGTPDSLSPNWLSGVARLVYEYCDNAKLSPIVRSWHDGCGTDGGYKMVIRW